MEVSHFTRALLCGKEQNVGLPKDNSVVYWSGLIGKDASALHFENWVSLALSLKIALGCL